MADREHISQTIYDVEHKLIRLHQLAANHSTDPRLSGDAFCMLIKTACQLYVFTILRQMLGRSHVVQRYSRLLGSQIHNYVSEIDSLRGTGNDERDLLIWAMALLLWATYDDDDQKALAKLLAPLLESANLVNVNQLVLTLRSVAWMDDMLHEELSPVWVKLRLLKS